jgi:hypothetical protein
MGSHQRAPKKVGVFSSLIEAPAIPCRPLRERRESGAPTPHGTMGPIKNDVCRMVVGVNSSARKPKRRRERQLAKRRPPNSPTRLQCVYAVAVKTAPAHSSPLLPRLPTLAATTTNLADAARWHTMPRPAAAVKAVGSL